MVVTMRMMVLAGMAEPVVFLAVEEAEAVLLAVVVQVGQAVQAELAKSGYGRIR